MNKTSRKKINKIISIYNIYYILMTKAFFFNSLNNNYCGIICFINIIYSIIIYLFFNK